jgi:hypothetical protein
MFCLNVFSGLYTSFARLAGYYLVDSEANITVELIGSYCLALLDPVFLCGEIGSVYPGFMLIVARGLRKSYAKLESGRNLVL